MIPVTWYLILQLFGSNNFSLDLVDDITDCDQFEQVTIISRTDSVSIARQNYLDRVRFGAEKRNIAIILKEESFFNCINQSEADLVLVSEQGLWGGYTLTRDGVDQLLTELDILLIQQSYGKGAKR